MMYVVMYFVVLVFGVLLLNADALYQIHKIGKYEEYFAEAKHFNGKGL